MHKIDGYGITVANEFTEGNPAATPPVPATRVTDSWLNSVQREIIAPIEGAGLSLNKNEDNQLFIAIKRLVKETRYEVGAPFPLMEKRSPVAWSDANPDGYFPAICLTDIETHVDISATNAPDAVPFLRNLKVKYKDGLNGEISSPSVTNWAITSNVATLTFANNPDTIAFLAALLEDQVSHGSYTNWRTVTLASAIGNITAGTYALTNVNASSRTISFAFTAANASGAVTATVEFYAHRIAGSTTTARVFGARGLNLQGANDDNGYFVAGGLRRRGYTQGADYRFDILTNGVDVGGQVGTGATGLLRAGTALGGGSIFKATKVANATDGTPRVAKETHGPAMAVHLYMHLGRLNA